MVGTTQLKNKIHSSIIAQTREFEQVSARSFETKPDARRIKNWFLPYQMDYINWEVPFGVVQKGRRTGLSEAQAYRSNLNCLLNKKNSYYSTYNFPNSRVFIKKCAKWAKAFNLMSKVLYNREVINEKTGITMYKIEYLNGRFIEAIPDTPNSFRDKDSFGTEIIKDEAAFSDCLNDIVEAVKAVDIWNAGSTIRIISTHFGDQNPFNLLVQDCLKNPRKGEVKTIAFSEAVRQGLYRKICELKNEIWTPEKEATYLQYWIDFYGDASSQELEALPRKMGGSSLFHPSIFHFAGFDPDLLENSTKIRAWDFASTDVDSAKNSSYYTATTLCAIIPGGMLVLDSDARQLSPEDVELWIKELDQSDDRLTMWLIEQEPGSSGEFMSNHIRKLVTSHNVDSYKPIKSKVVRAQPMIGAFKRDEILFDAQNEHHLKDHLISNLVQFDGEARPLVNDLTDCLSMTLDWYQTDGDWIAA